MGNLVLTSKVDDTIVIGAEGSSPEEQIVVTVYHINETSVKLSIKAPENLFIFRGSVMKKIPQSEIRSRAKKRTVA